MIPNKLIKIFFLLMLIVNVACSQSISKDDNRNTDEELLNQKIGEIISNDFLIDSLQMFKVVFTLKVDSTGEVHSAHIRWSKNLKHKDYYKICSKIERDFNLLFVYKKYKEEFKGEKYVYYRYPYFSKL